MNEAVTKLIAKYEAELRQASIDQRTDDAMSSEAYRVYSEVMGRVINNLKTLAAQN